jgi:hypothetical protein
MLLTSVRGSECNRKLGHTSDQRRGSVKIDIPVDNHIVPCRLELPRKSDVSNLPKWIRRSGFELLAWLEPYLLSNQQRSKRWPHLPTEIRTTCGWKLKVNTMQHYRPILGLMIVVQLFSAAIKIIIRIL